MSLSMYEASAPTFASMLRNLDAILVKAQAHATTHKIDPAVLLNARLFPNMYPLLRQVQIATDQAKGCVARLAGVEIPRFEDSEKSFEEIRERLAKTIAFVDSVSAAQINGSEDRDIVVKAGSRELNFKGQPYLVGFVLPNFYFHLVTAYNILRHNGVELGKHDYTGEF